MYLRVKNEDVPFQLWHQWIDQQLIEEDKLQRPEFYKEPVKGSGVVTKILSLFKNRRKMTASFGREK